MSGGAVPAFCRARRRRRRVDRFIFDLREEPLPELFPHRVRLRQVRLDLAQTLLVLDRLEGTAAVLDDGRNVAADPWGEAVSGDRGEHAGLRLGDRPGVDDRRQVERHRPVAGPPHPLDQERRGHVALPGLGQGGADDGRHVLVGDHAPGPG